MSESRERLVIDDFSYRLHTFGIRYWHEGLYVEMRLVSHSRPEHHFRVQEIVSRQHTIMGRMGHKQRARGQQLLAQIRPIFEAALDLYGYQSYSWQQGLIEGVGYLAPAELIDDEQNQGIVSRLMAVACQSEVPFVFQPQLMSQGLIVVGFPAPEPPSRERQIETTLQAYKNGLISPEQAVAAIVRLSDE